MGQQMKKKIPKFLLISAKSSCLIFISVISKKEEEDEEEDEEEGFDVQCLAAIPAGVDATVLYSKILTCRLQNHWYYNCLGAKSTSKQNWKENC